MGSRGPGIDEGGRHGGGRRHAHLRPRRDPEGRPAPGRAVAVPDDQRLSVRWPTMSRPRRIHERRASPRRRLVDSATAPARRPVRPVAPARRTASRLAGRERRDDRVGLASAAGRSDAARRPPGRSRDEQVHRAAGQQRATDSQASSSVPGRDDHQPLQVDALATASTGIVKLRQDRQANDSPCRPASAASRRTSVVRPLDRRRGWRRRF